MNCLGCCTGNTEGGAFFHSLKGNIWKNTFATVDKLLAELKVYLNDFYNGQRLHSSLGYKTPVGLAGSRKLKHGACPLYWSKITFHSLPSFASLHNY